MLCVEILSPNKRMRQTLEKVREYLASGVKMVWVIAPEDGTVTVFRKPGEGHVFDESAALTGEDVLPGFSCKVAELFA